MTREQDERLNKLRESGVEIYSISRLGTINNCLAEAYKTYVLKDRGRQNIFGALGSRVHDTLEAIVNNEATEEELLPAMNAEFDDLDALGIEFPKDFKGGDSIRESWISNMTHFCQNYKSPKGDNLHTEELFIYKTPKGRYLQGYIDLYKENKDKSISIYDYKTSSLYKGADLIDHGRQLVTYALGKEQEGYNVKSVAWIFLKYVNVSFMGYKTAKSKEKTPQTMIIERRKIGEELAKYVERDLYNFGIDEVDAEVYLSELKEKNSLDVLPKEIAANYTIRPCVFEYELTDEVKQECIDYIDNTIDMWEALEQTNELNYPPRKFTKTTKAGKESPDYFYCTNLCGHFKNCTYIHDYLDTLSVSKDDDEDLF